MAFRCSTCRRPRRPGLWRCTASPGCRLCPMPAATMRAQARHQSDRPMGQALQWLFRAGVAAPYHGAAAGIDFQPWPAGDPQFRDDVAIAPVRLAARAVQTAGADLRARRPMACPGSRPLPCWPCRDCAWTTARSGCETGLDASGGRNRAPDPARWRPCQPLAGSAAHRLSPCRDGAGSAERGGRGAAAQSAQCP